MAKKKASKTSKASAVRKKMTKSEIYRAISDKTGLARKEVAAVFEELETLIHRHVKKGGAGEFMLPGLLKIKTRKIPARKAKKGVPNPFRPGELMDIKARPATIRVKVSPLKKLKDMAK